MDNRGCRPGVRAGASGAVRPVGEGVDDARGDSREAVRARVRVREMFAEARNGEYPVRRCRSCGRKLYTPSPVCRSRKCPEYSRVWAGDQRVRLFRNLEEFGGDVLLGAVTGPGVDQLPWDEDACRALGPHKHEGKLGCRVDHRYGDPWNRTAPERWRRLHRRAYQDTLRKFGRGSVVMLARVWEQQSRGVLHVHPVVAHETPRQKAGARYYLRRLGELAPQYEFGFARDDPKFAKPRPAQNAAAYLSSYFVKGRGRKAALWQSVTSNAMPRSIVHVSSRLTQATGCTMRNLRLKRGLRHHWGVEPTMEEVAFVAKLIDAFATRQVVDRFAVDRAPPQLVPV